VGTPSQAPVNQNIPAFEWRTIMLKLRIAAFGIACFALGAQMHLGSAQSRPAFDAELMKTKPPTEAADFLLAEASRLAGTGSWERIAVGRAWYLGGRKERGQEIFDSVTETRKVEDSDWFRIGRVYAEAGEWDKAQLAFDKALAMNPGDDSGMIEYGAFANVFRDRTKAEAWFATAMKRKPREFWHWVAAGGSYLGVRPPQ
jgi:tetratricopeptide (TPR) repeat protein